MIEFLLNDQPVQLDSVAPTLNALDWLRTKSDHKGTKEGCASGDCGACTVVVGEQTSDGIRYRHVNACLLLVGNLHGKHLITVEGISDRSQENPEQLHPVQRALVECHGTQCGFCTPGFVMSMYALYINERDYPGETEVVHQLGGNLCRCTGYRPILEACKAMYEYPRADDTLRPLAETFFAQSRIEHPVLNHDHGRFHLPQSLAELLTLKAEHPSAPVVAGGTDLSLTFTQLLRTAEHVISLNHVPELKQLETTDAGLCIGAAVTYEDFLPLFLEQYPEAREIFLRLGSEQIRNVGTLGGSFANASPIGDPAPVLIALGATVSITSQHQTRIVPLESFFLAYRKTILAEDEVIVSIDIPTRQAETKLACYKISKRIEDDISSVLMAIKYQLVDNRMLNVKTGFGGMAATPLAAKEMEAALEGQIFSEHTLQSASEHLENDFNPMTDVRASRDYRLTVCKNLMQRLWLEQAKTVTTRIAHAAL